MIIVRVGSHDPSLWGSTSRIGSHDPSLWGSRVWRSWTKSRSKNLILSTTMTKDLNRSVSLSRSPKFEPEQV